MTMREFIKQNRASLDECIQRARDFVPRTASCYCHKNGTDHLHTNERGINDSERREWILNDEGLYRWARQEGVRI
jgi:hypothetical protein